MEKDFLGRKERRNGKEKGTEMKGAKYKREDVELMWRTALNKD